MAEQKLQQEDLGAYKKSDGTGRLTRYERNGSLITAFEAQYDPNTGERVQDLTWTANYDQLKAQQEMHESEAKRIKAMLSQLKDVSPESEAAPGESAP